MSWYWGCQGKHNTVKQRRNKARSASAVDIIPPWPADPSPSNQHRAVALHAPLLCHRTKDPVPFSQGTDLAVGLARCHMTHTLKQNKRTHIWVWNMKGISRQDDKTSIVCKDSYLLERDCSWSSAHSYTAKWKGSKDCMQETAFPNIPLPTCAGPLKWQVKHIKSYRTITHLQVRDGVGSTGGSLNNL